MRYFLLCVFAAVILCAVGDFWFDHSMFPNAFLLKRHYEELVESGDGADGVGLHHIYADTTYSLMYGGGLLKVWIYWLEPAGNQGCYYVHDVAEGEARVKSFSLEYIKNRSAFERYLETRRLSKIKLPRI